MRRREFLFGTSSLVMAVVGPKIIPKAQPMMTLVDYAERIMKPSIDAWAKEMQERVEYNLLHGNPEFGPSGLISRYENGRFP